jgi:D-alanyl-D-alanine endopeptidase (penicillin-binding protein 7)
MKRLLIVALLTVSTCWAKNEPSVLLYNATTGHKLVSENPDQVRALASITKLMTAMVALDTGFGPDRIAPVARCCGGFIPPKTYKRSELLTAMLVKSDNSAAEALANDYPGGRAEFIREMNERAQRLGMTSTHFEDASGLDKRNVSTVHDIKIMVLQAMTYDVIRNNTTKIKAEIKLESPKKARVVTLMNTNQTLLGEFKSTVLGKTGFINASGFCVAMALEQDDQQWVMVILGAKSKDQRKRIAERMLLSLHLK